jgi:PAS domain S-box-containing protein
MELLYSMPSTADLDHAINQRIFETSLDLILVVDRGGNIIRVSPSSERILGYKPEQMVGRSAREFVFHEDLKSTRHEMRQARHGQETRNFDCRYLHKTGRVVPLAWTGVWSEAAQQYFFIGRDMSERLEAEERQRRSQRLEAIGQLTGGIAHDFNNLLSVVIGNLELLQRQFGADESVAHRLRRALRAALRGAELTGQLLAFARQQPLEARVVDMNSCIVETIGLLERTLGEAIVIETRLDDQLWRTYADPTQLESALVNLSLNARDAMPDGGQLRIQTANVTFDTNVANSYVDAPPGDYTMLAVSDTGTGMSPEILSRVFEPFFTTKPPGKGTGMGLSMVFGFARQSNGGVRIYSEIGHGTTVRLYLPRAQAEGEAADPETDKEALMARRGECILVAEDNPDVCAIVVEQLSNLGYRVLQTSGGEAALDALKSEPAVDLLFTDVVMPGGMSGVELARAARSLRPDLKVLLTSGFAVLAMERAGADNWPLLTKPYRQIELATKLRRTLNG